MTEIVTTSVSGNNPLLVPRKNPQVPQLEFEVPDALTKVLRDLGAAGPKLTQLSNFRAPTGFQQFAGRLGTAAGDVGSIETGLGAAIPQADELSDALRGSLDTARSLTQGSFGPGGQLGGVIPEAIGQARTLGTELGNIQVPDITPALEDTRGLQRLVDDVIGDVGPTGALQTQLGATGRTLGGLEATAGGLNIDAFDEALRRTRDVALPSTQEAADALNLTRFGGLVGGTGEDLTGLQEAADLLNLGTLPGAITGAGTELAGLQQVADRLNLGTFPEAVGGAGRDVGILQEAANALNLGTLPTGIEGAGLGIAGLQSAADRLSLGTLPGGIEGAGLGIAGLQSAADRLNLGGLPTGLEGAGLGIAGLQSAADRLNLGILPGAIEGAGLGIAGLQSATDRLSLGTLPGGIEGAGLGIAGLRSAADRLNLGAFPDQIGEAGRGIAGLQTAADALTFPQPLTAQQLLPGEDELAALFQDLRPGALLPRDLLPPGEVLGDAFDILRPPRLTPEELLPGREELQLQIDQITPEIAFPAFRPEDFRRELDKLGGGLDELLGRQGPARLEDIIAALGTGGGGGQTPAPEGLDAFLQELQGVVSGLTTGPTTSAELRADPLTQSLLADFEAQGTAKRSQLTEDLQRLGVLRSGDAADVLGEFEAGQTRGEFDLLGDAAVRFRQDRIAGLGSGVNLFGAAGQRELGQGQLGLQNRQTDLDILAAVTAALDPALDLGTQSETQRQLARALLGLTGIDPATRAQLLDLIRTNRS